MASSEGDIAVSDPESEGERLAITWFLHNWCTSNSQLAVVSNVCRRWSEIASATVASEAFALATGLRNNGISTLLLEAGDASTSASPSFSSLRGLLLTDMARELVVRQQEHNNNPSTATSTAQDEHPNNSKDGNFCLAWFAPSGIQSVSVSLDDDDDVDAEEEDFRFDIGSAGTSSDNISMHRQKRRGKNQPRVRCCSEWRGYRHATEVLLPFGYSAGFVQSVLEASTDLAAGSEPPTTEPSSSSTPIPLFRSNSQQSKTPSHLYDPTFAVRGATLARPEGFCLCLDQDYIEQANSATFEKPPHAAKHCVPSCIDGWMSDYDDSEWPLQSNMGLSPMQRRRKQSILAKALLPRMVMSTRRKYPLLHRFEEEEAGEKAAPKHFPWEKRQRAVQFLNSDRSQAVKLITPKFECGPTPGPITMFLVAITTEDGCFVSGRSRRFELGHLYPLGARDMEFDMSPVAIATGKRETGDGRDSSAAGTASSDDDNDSSDSERSMHCLCKFDSGDPFNPKDHSIEDPKEDCIHRGCTGPGLWHCYSAVFDGKESTIRVDGCKEPKRTREHYGLGSSDEEDGDDEDDADSPANASRFVGTGLLDGLSLGSDHTFDMSLCYGEIEGECGQGAIAEIAVFKGRMNDADIETLEDYLMKKHGILSVKEKRDFVAKNNGKRDPSKHIDIDCHLKEDEWRRQAHALIEQRRPWKLKGQVPLRVAANHHSVAWHRTNDITGASVRIARIGAKNSNGSSDW